jgi:hypothetical protein
MVIQCPCCKESLSVDDDEIIEYLKKVGWKSAWKQDPVLSLDLTQKLCDTIAHAESCNPVDTITMISIDKDGNICARTGPKSMKWLDYETERPHLIVQRKKNSCGE